METPDLYSSNHPAPVASLAAADLERTVAGLRAIFSATLVILILGSLLVNFFLFRQVGAARRQSEELEKRMQLPGVAQYETVTKPRISAFLNALVGFARSNQDFAAILGKYPIDWKPAPQPAVPPPGPATPPTK